MILHTTNALTWVVEGFDFASGTLLFGRRADDLGEFKPPALGHSFFQIVFWNTAPGAPLPDLMELLYNEGAAIR